VIDDDDGGTGDKRGEEEGVQADAAQQEEGGYPRSAATLVICPMTLLSQWESECLTHLHDIKVLVYYGAERAKNTDLRFSDVDVVITTYGVVTSEHFAAQREESPPLFGVCFCE
jgi:SNF2 family DNA or RNA helicase